MTPVLAGAVLGMVFGLGCLLVVRRLGAARTLVLDLRVRAYLRDLPQSTPSVADSTGGSVAWAVFGPFLLGAAGVVERVLGGASTVERRLERAGLELTVRDFRVSQVLWGLVAFALTAVPAGLVAADSPRRTVPLLVCCLVVGVLGVLLRENWLTARVRARERAMLEEFPTIAELLALAVAAGEGPVAALDRVVSRCRGAMAGELSRVLAAVRTGTPVSAAFDHWSTRTGLPVLARFAEAVAIAIERGTPLADVLHAQAADVREAGRRSLIEAGARKEVLMMVPVVFLILPTVVVFAFFPGLVGLRLVV